MPSHSPVAFLPAKTLLSTKQIQKQSSHFGSGNTNISETVFYPDKEPVF